MIYTILKVVNRKCYKNKKIIYAIATTNWKAKKPFHLRFREWDSQKVFCLIKPQIDTEHYPDILGRWLLEELGKI